MKFEQQYEIDSTARHVAHHQYAIVDSVMQKTFVTLPVWSVCNNHARIFFADLNKNGRYKVVQSLHNQLM